MKLLKILGAGALMFSMFAFCSCSGSDKKEVNTRVNMAVTDTTDVEVDTTFLKEFKDYKMKESFEMAYADDKITTFNVRLSVPIPIDTFNKLKTVESGFTFGYALFKVDKTTVLKDLTFKGYYPATTFDEKFSKYLSGQNFIHDSYSVDQFAFVDKNGKEIESKNADFAQVNRVFSILGQEDVEFVWFSYLACDGNLVITDSSLTSGKKLAEKTVKAGETPEGECLTKEEVDILCKHFDIKKPWYSDMQVGYKGMLNDHKGWTITLSCLSGLCIIILIVVLVVFLKKKLKG